MLIGSVATSARPVLEITFVTSGNSVRPFRLPLLFLSDWVSETLGKLLYLHRKRTFVKTRNKLSPEKREKSEACQNHRRACAKRLPPIAHHPIKGGHIDFLRPANKNAFRFRNLVRAR